jgi:transposase
VEFNFIESTSDQVYLLPPDAREWLPAGHLTWHVLDSVAQMDLSAFLSAYRRDGQGAAAYHPAVMVALLLYCYCKGVRSSRAIETASHDDVGARVILGNRHPDHATVARFVERHQQQMRPLFVRVLAQCAKQGLVTVDVVAADGTKVKANASMKATVTAEELDLDIAELEAVLAAEVDEWFAQAQREDATDEALLDTGDGDGDPGSPAAPSPMSRLVDTIARRYAAQAKLAAEEQARRDLAEAERQDNIDTKTRLLARAEAAYEREQRTQQAKIDAYQQRYADKKAAGNTAAPLGPAPIPVTEHTHVRKAATRVQRARNRLAQAITAEPVLPAKPLTVNTTDPGSRIMLGKKKEFLQARNLQALGNSRQILLAIGTHDNPADVGALHPLLQAGRANLDAAGVTDRIGDALADSGYASTANFTTVCEPTLYIAVTNEARQTGRRKDAAPKAIGKEWQQMADRLATPDGKALYKRRGAIIEPIFAQLFQRLGRTLNYRGEFVDAELQLWGSSHNLLKLFRHRRRTADAHATMPA